GTTIQAYAGICGPDDLQPHSDDYFHSVSLDEMIAYTTTGAGGAASPVPTGNTPPTVRGAGPFTIPRGTPFALTATGTDPDGDPLTLRVVDAGPFRVSPTAGGPQSGLLSVTWDVAGTDQAPINTAAVDVLLSTDGGLTFPATLAASVPNTGFHTVTLPSVS